MDRAHQRLCVWKRLLRNYELYLFLLPALAYFLIFKYIPMYGIQIAFRDYVPSYGFWESQWVGMKHFQRFWESYNFSTLIKNTLTLTFYSLVVGFPIPVILAIMLNEQNHKWFKKTVQTVTYAPHFISLVVLCGMVITFFSPSKGVVNKLISLLGGEPVYFLASVPAFKHLYVWTGIWQNMGWSSIIYLAALSNVDPELIEASVIDGAKKLQRIRYISLPCIMPTIITMLILRCGNLMDVGFEKVYLLQNDLNLSASEVISTYVYRVGVQGGEYSFSAAVGVFNSVINFILLIVVNRIAKAVGQAGLW